MLVKDITLQVIDHMKEVVAIKKWSFRIPTPMKRSLTRRQLGGS